MPLLKFIFFLAVMLLVLAALAAAYAVVAGDGAMLVFLWYFLIYVVPAFTVLLFLVVGVSIYVERQSARHSGPAGTRGVWRQKIGRVLVFVGFACALLGLLWQAPERLVYMMEGETRYALLVGAVLLRNALPGLLVVLLGYHLLKPASPNAA